MPARQLDMCPELLSCVSPALGSCDGCRAWEPFASGPDILSLHRASSRCPAPLGVLTSAEFSTTTAHSSIPGLAGTSTLDALDPLMCVLDLLPSVRAPRPDLGLSPVATTRHLTPHAWNPFSGPDRDEDHGATMEALLGHDLDSEPATTGYPNMIHTPVATAAAWSLHPAVMLETGPATPARHTDAAGISLVHNSGTTVGDPDEAANTWCESRFGQLAPDSVGSWGSATTNADPYSALMPAFAFQACTTVYCA